MKLIPSYQEFVDSMDLNGKISPELAESLASDFQEIESLNEGFLDSIKNTLSKSFLGSLSYINMIDKAREMMLKDQKDLLSKKYSHEDEIDSLNSSLKQAQTSADSVNSDRIKKTIANKENEYKTYVNMVKKRIEKTEDTIYKIIEGNKRRSEYYDAGKSQDELTIAEFEYKLAKTRAGSDPKKIKELETKVKTAKEEAEEAQEELKASAEKQEKKEEGDKLNKKSELSNNVDEIDSAIRRCEESITELEKKRADRPNKKLSPVDKESLESNKALLKKLKNRRKDVERAMKGSNASRRLKNQAEFTQERRKANQNLKAVPGGKSKPEGEKAASMKKS